jgi:hypothetical protein
MADKREDMPRPARRTDGLIVERLPGELLVYDQERDEAHCLHTESAAVFDLLDGTRTGGDVAALASLTEARVEEVLSELAARHLIEDDSREDDGLSRRDVIHRGALTGAGVAGAALITSIVAPLPAAAQSPNGCNRGECSPEGRFCGFDEGGPCYCFDSTDSGAVCIDNSGYAGDCDQSGGCPEGSFCIDDEECTEFDGCYYTCGDVPEALRQANRTGRSSAASRWFKLR